MIIKMFYYILVILLSLLIKKIISKSKIINPKYLNSILILNVLTAIVFVLFFANNYGDFPFKSTDDDNKSKTRELNNAFSKRDVQVSSFEYDSVEKRIMAYFNKELEVVKTDEQFQQKFRIYGINDKRELKVLVDTIIFSPDKQIFSSSILFRVKDEYISASVIGVNSSNGKILNNYGSLTMKESDISFMSINTRYYYFIRDSNKDKKDRYRIDQKKYWINIEKKILSKNACS